CDVIDPASLGVGGERFARAFVVSRRHLAVVTAGDHTLTVAGRGQNRAAMDSGAMVLAVAPKKKRRLAKDAPRGVAGEMERREPGTGRDRTDALDERGGVRARVGHLLRPRTPRIPCGSSPRACRAR